MTIANKLIVLRDKYKYSQQQVADALGVSKSTYCRYEQGKADIGVQELSRVLSLYGISYEDFVGVTFPLEREITYPQKLLDNLQKVIEKNGVPVGDYEENRLRYDRIKEAMLPVLLIRDEAMDFPSVDIYSIQPGTTVKVVKLDMRGEKLIAEGLRAQHDLFSAMMNRNP